MVFTQQQTSYLLGLGALVGAMHELESEGGGFMKVETHGLKGPLPPPHNAPLVHFTCSLIMCLCTDVQLLGISRPPWVILAFQSCTPCLRVVVRMVASPQPTYKAPPGVYYISFALLAAASRSIAVVVASCKSHALSDNVKCAPPTGTCLLNCTTKESWALPVTCTPLELPSFV
jgi:hypothetical protein